MELPEVKNFLKVDDEDEDIYIEELIQVAQIYIDETCGEAYKEHPNKVKLAELYQKKLILDMFENRGTRIDKSKADNIAGTITDILSNCEEVL